MVASGMSFRDVLVCEDHPFVRIGIETFMRKLAHQCEVRLAATGKEAIRMAKEKCPEVALVDLGLPDMSGLEVIQSLQKISTAIKILVVTGCDNPSMILSAKKLGVAGIMQKASSLEHLDSMLKELRISGDRTLLDPSIAGLLDDREDVDFTAKEFEVLQEIIKGLSNQQIAEELGCSVYSVRFHRANILSKAGVRSAAELTAWFLQGQRKSY